MYQVAADVLPDPYYETNWLNASFLGLVHGNEWVYSAKFSSNAAAAARLLVLDGIKMGATVKLDGELLGRATDQFRRYVFPLPSELAAAHRRHTLEIVFTPNISCAGRWMACSGNADWAPYTFTYQRDPGIKGPMAIMSKGIWKSVYIAAIDSVAIEHVVPHTMYRGEYPVVPLVDGNHAGFNVHARVHLYSTQRTNATITARGEWGETVTM
eukprot:SAG31_NODE_17906_length_654_cov_0.736937_1_plen_211_part_10